MAKSLSAEDIDTSQEGDGSCFRNCTLDEKKYSVARHVPAEDSPAELLPREGMLKFDFVSL